MKFHYTALSSSGQKVEGVLDSETLEIAKGELHKMELSIVEIHPLSDQESTEEEAQKKALKEAGVNNFIFQVVDTEGKTVEGSIEAKSDEAALKRLITEYHFKVQALYLAGSSDEEKKESEGRLKNLLKELELQGITLQVGKQKKEEWDATERGLDDEIIKEVDKIIGAAKKVMTDHTALFTPEKLNQIKKTTDELERVRTSNNLRHIAEISNQVFELIDAPDNPQGKMGADSEYLRAMSEIEKSELLKKEMGIHKKSIGLGKIRATFDRLKKQLTFLGKKSPPTPLSSASKEILTKDPTAPLEPGFKKIMVSLKAYLSASNPLAKKTRKRDLAEAWKEWTLFRKTEKKSTTVAPEVPKEVQPKNQPGKRNFAPLFMEVDSFISWLLCFYLLYFFLVGFSLEKGLGLPEGFVVKTLRSPLIFNITFFLLVTHFLLRVKTRRFHQNALGSLFLFFFGYGLFTLILFNF